MFSSNETKPIYIQIADWLENEIMRGHFLEDAKVPSQYQLADLFTVNPATAAKGLNLLAEAGLLYKKRGLGMFVAAGSKELIYQKRRSDTLSVLVKELIDEAKRLDVPLKDLTDMIEIVYKEDES